jgi:hypothetical protein
LLDKRHTGRLRKRDRLLTGEGGGGEEEGAKAYERESMVIYNILNTLCIYPNPLRGTIPLPPHQFDIYTEKRREVENRFST